MNKVKHQLTEAEIENIADREKYAQYIENLDGSWGSDFHYASLDYHLRLIEKRLPKPFWAFWQRDTMLIVMEYDNPMHGGVASEFAERRARMIERRMKVKTIVYTRYLPDVTPSAHPTRRPMPDASYGEL